LRIIGGKARGRRLQTPSKSSAKYSGQHIRPTADRAREALFSILGREVENATVLDLYAGTGALGLEALSRSAERTVFVDYSSKAVQIIKKNIELCGFSDRTLVFKRDLTKGLSFLLKQLPGTTFSIVFVDPPYRKGLSAGILQKLAESDLLCPEALVVVEDDAVIELPAQVADLTLVDQRCYGETAFWLYRKKQLFINLHSKGEVNGRKQ
jgi:16S rRNA (guanine966-N2)-methyltransferase